MKACVAVAVAAMAAGGVDAFVNPTSFMGAGVMPQAQLQQARRAASAAAPMTMEWFWGEEEYKTFVAGYKENALVNQVYPIVERVREKKLLTSTAESGVLSALEDAGLTLSQAEKLLPLVEEAGLLSFAAKNADFLLNTVGFLAVEPAELALPAVTGAIRSGLLSGFIKGLPDISAAAPKTAKTLKVTAAKATAAPKAAARPVAKVAAVAAKPVAATVKAAPKAAAVVRPVMKAPPRAAGPSISAVPKAAISAAKSAVSKPVLKAAPKPVMKAAPKPAPKPVVKAAPKPAPKPVAAKVAPKKLVAVAKPAPKPVVKAAPKPVVKAAAPKPVAPVAVAKPAAPAARKVSAPLKAPAAMKGSLGNIPKRVPAMA